MKSTLHCKYSQQSERKKEWAAGKDSFKTLALLQHAKCLAPKSDMSTLVYHSYKNKKELMNETTQAPSHISLVTLIPDLCAKFTMLSSITTEGNRKHLSVE